MRDDEIKHIVSVPAPPGLIEVWRAAMAKLYAEEKERERLAALERDYYVPWWQRFFALIALAVAVWIVVPWSLFELAGECYD